MKDRDLGSSINPDEAGQKRRVHFRGARLALAAMAATGAVACSQNPPIACPTNEAGVSQQVGGFPANWRSMDGISWAWVFESDYYQRLTYPSSKGRLEILDGEFINGSLKRGTVRSLEEIETRRAFYVCVDEESLQDQGSPAPTAVPTSTITTR